MSLLVSSRQRANIYITRDVGTETKKKVGLQVTIINGTGRVEIVIVYQIDLHWTDIYTASSSSHVVLSFFFQLNTDIVFLSCTYPFF